MNHRGFYCYFCARALPHKRKRNPLFFALANFFRQCGATLVPWAALVGPKVFFIGGLARRFYAPRQRPCVPGRLDQLKQKPRQVCRGLMIIPAWICSIV